MTTDRLPTYNNLGIHQALRDWDGAALEAALQAGEDPNAGISSTESPPEDLDDAGAFGSADLPRRTVTWHPVRWVLEQMGLHGERPDLMALLTCLLCHGADPNAAPLDWESWADLPLHEAIQRTLPQATRLLLAHGADIDAPSNTYFAGRPIHTLASRGYGSVDALADLGRTLLAAGASLDDDRNEGAYTPLHITILETNARALEALLTLRPMTPAEGLWVCGLLERAHLEDTTPRMPLPLFGEAQAVLTLVLEALVPLAHRDEGVRLALEPALAAYRAVLLDQGPTLAGSVALVDRVAAQRLRAALNEQVPEAGAPERRLRM